MAHGWKPSLLLVISAIGALVLVLIIQMELENLGLLNTLIKSALFYDVLCTPLFILFATIFWRLLRAMFLAAEKDHQCTKTK